MQTQSLFFPRWLDSDGARCALAASLICAALAAVLLLGRPDWWPRAALAGLAPFALLLLHRPSARYLIAAAIVILAAVVIFHRLGEGSFYDWDEAYYAEVARELAQSGNWGALTFGGYPFWHKPPLYFWATAALAGDQGVNELTARVLPAVAGLGVVSLTLLFGIELFSWAAGALAAILLLVVDHGSFSHWQNFVSQSRVAMLETMLTLWLTASLLIAWKARERPQRICWIGVTTGLAVMTKSWPGFAAFALPFLFSLIDGRFRRQFRYWVFAGLILLAVILPWHIWQIYRHGAPFIQDYFVVNVVGRMLGLVQQEARSPFFYLGILRRGFGIFAYAALFAVVWAIWRRRGEHRAQISLLLVWIFVPLMLFSLASTKLGWYVLLLYPAVVLITASTAVALAGGAPAFASGAVIMALLYFRLPVPSDGVPGIHQFAAGVERTVGAEPVAFYNVRGCQQPPDTTGYVQSEIWSITPTLIYYIDRPLSCTDRIPKSTGPSENTYVLIDKAQLNEDATVTDAVLESQRFALVRGNTHGEERVARR